MDKEFVVPWILGIALGFSAGVIVVSVTKNQDWQREVIRHGAAHYDKQSGAFTWNEFKDNRNSQENASRKPEIIIPHGPLTVTTETLPFDPGKYHTKLSVTTMILPYTWNNKESGAFIWNEEKP